ncbi:MAG: N-acetylmuramoyl-L-alanine amidase [Candidatus Peregrinibacteria bacterium]|nr:N-acetylmuramoyl-L-alanine amidase [Candidatus Peregrinibacteria bacterium]
MNKKIFSILTAIFGILVFGFFSFSNSQNAVSGQTKALTVSSEREITIDSQKLAYSSLLIAPYKTVDVFLSDVMDPGFEFTSVGGSWSATVPNGTNVEAQLKFFENGKWSDWFGSDEEEESMGTYESGKDTKFYTTASSNGSTKFQYRFLMYGDGISSPVIKNPDWTFIKSSDEVVIPSPPEAQFAASASGNIDVISRKNWGADESYRYLKDNSEDPVLAELDSDYLEKYKDELAYTKVLTEDSKGNKYKWPLQYPKQVKKFVVHHTATTGNLDNPAQAMRDIYYYHAITRAWGDIGYNYLMDQSGKVYEGRVGGEGVIGAHAGGANNGSIGIAVLGNYEDNIVPEKVINALGKFIAQKAKMHNIDVIGKSTFRGENSWNILGHSDVKSTDCPGVYLYEKLPILRTLANKAMHQQKERFVEDYDYEDKSETYYMEMNPDVAAEVTIKLENIGKKEWDANTFIVVDQNPEFNGMISFPTQNEDVLAKLQESKVSSGGTGTFKFSIKSYKKGGVVNMKITILFNGEKKSLDYVTIPVSVNQANFKYTLVSSSFPNETMEKGETFSATVKLQNTGNTVWRKSGENTVLLGADHERDRTSLIVSPPSTRMGYLQESEVNPGEIGTFIISIKAPDKAGYFKEYFTPVVEAVTWMKDSGMYFETTVLGGDYAAELIGSSYPAEWKQGSKNTVEMTFRNLGRKTWTKNNTKLDFVKSKNLKISNITLSSNEVKSGGIAKVSFTAEVSSSELPGRKIMLVTPKVDGNPILEKSVYVKYKVVNTPTKSALSPTKISSSDSRIKTGSDTEKNIRIKLSFSLNPVVSANGSFEIYNGNSLVATLSSGETAEVSKSDKKYKITTASNTYYQDSYVRFKPKNAAILRVDNFNHSPDWNKDLNDNEYRGILEVRDVDGTLTVINELPLENYLKGLGEVSNSEVTEKIKSVMIAARSYALFYIEKDQKFKGKPYNLDDDPNVSQKYLGYGMEKRSPNVAKAVDATKGQVITLNGDLVKTPYFNQTDGTYTKSAKSVWNWDASYLVRVSDSYCKGDAFSGHGVGLSGCGAKGMAEAGFNYIDILLHYYTGVEVTDMY